MEGITIYWDPHLESWVNVSYLATQEDGAMVFTTTVASRQKSADKLTVLPYSTLFSTGGPQEMKKQEPHRYSRPG